MNIKENIIPVVESDMTPATFTAQVDETTLHVPMPDPTGHYLMEQVGKDPKTHFLVQILVGQDDIVIEADDRADLCLKGIERFDVVSRAKRYAITINEGEFVLDIPDPTGLALLKIVDKSPDKYALVQIIPFGDDQFISPDEKANLRPAGKERFITVLKDEKCGVDILVNNKPVSLPRAEETGLQIKERAIEQKVSIQRDFLLFDTSKGGMEPVGDNVTIHLHCGQKFLATAPDDNS